MVTHKDHVHFCTFSEDPKITLIIWTGPGTLTPHQQRLFAICWEDQQQLTHMVSSLPMHHPQQYPHFLGPGQHAFPTGDQERLPPCRAAEASRQPCHSIDHQSFTGTLSKKLKIPLPALRATAHPHMSCPVPWSPKTGMSPCIRQAHSFQPSSTASQSPGTPDHQHRCSVAIQTVPTWTLNQSMQTYGSPMPLPVCQPFQTYQPEDLGFSFLNSKCTQLLTILEIWMSLLSPVGLLASGNLTITWPLYHRLLELSQHHVHSSKATQVKGLTIAFIIPLGMLARNIWINLLLISFFQVLFSMETITVGCMQRDLWEFCHLAERAGLATEVVWALNFRVHHLNNIRYK